jgi:2,5-dihydroxypyridine 5,6-dioxygenase
VSTGRSSSPPGDVLLPFNTYVQTPVTLTIEGGFIRDIRGGLDAELLSSYIRSFDDPRGYGMSHVGWGLDERAHWHGLTQFGGGMGMELRSFYGNVMFSIGPNNELGGPNDTACHFDIPMRGNSLYLDDELIVDNGELTVPELRRTLR